MDTTQGEMLSRSSLQPFSASTNLQIARNHFIEVKLIKKIGISDTTSNYVSTSAWLRYASNMKRDKRHFHFCNLSKYKT